MNEMSSIFLTRTEVGIFSLVKEKLVANFLDNDVPGVVRPRTGHQSSKDSVSAENIAFLFFSQSLDDRVLSRCDHVDDAVDFLKASLILRRHAIVGLVIIFKSTTSVTGRNLKSSFEFRNIQ